MTVHRFLGAATACLAGLGALSAGAQSFGIRTVEDLKHYDVIVNVSAVTNMIAARIANSDPVGVDCRVSFDTGPGTVVRRVRVASGKSRTVSYAVRRTTTQRVTVTTRCRGVDGENDDAPGKASDGRR